MLKISVPLQTICLADQALVSFTFGGQPHPPVRFQRPWNSIPTGVQYQVPLDTQGIPSDGPVRALLVSNVPQFNL